jgi:hypothetical protein
LADPLRDVDVEEVDLAVRRRHRPVAVEDQRGVVGTGGVRAALVERAREHPHAEFPRSVGEERSELAIGRLGLGFALGRAEVVDVLGKDREVGPGLGRPPQQVARGGEVGRPVGAGVDLAHGDSHGHQPKRVRPP